MLAGTSCCCDWHTSLHVFPFCAFTVLDTSVALKTGSKMATAGGLVKLVAADELGYVRALQTTNDSMSSLAARA